jgi:hypothetical protein
MVCYGQFSSAAELATLDTIRANRGATTPARVRSSPTRKWITGDAGHISMLGLNGELTRIDLLQSERGAKMDLLLRDSAIGWRPLFARAA